MSINAKLIENLYNKATSAVDLNKLVQNYSRSQTRVFTLTVSFHRLSGENYD